MYHCSVNHLWHSIQISVSRVGVPKVGIVEKVGGCNTLSRYNMIERLTIATAHVIDEFYGSSSIDTGTSDCVV